MSTNDIEFKKNRLYKPSFINSNNLKDQPVNEVSDPQKPNPNINLYFLEISKALIKPNKKQPTILTIKISSTYHRNIAAGIAAIDIIKKIFLS